MARSLKQPDSNDLSDEALLALFVRGPESESRQALRVLADRHEARLLGLSLGLCNGREDLAGDAVQETWIRVIRHASKFKGRSSFATWVYRIAVHRCRDIVARERSLARRSSTTLLPGESFVAGTDSSWIRVAVAELPQSEREVVLLCHMRGMTHEQSAAVLGIPPGTLKTRMTRAMQRLRAQAQADERDGATP